MSSPKTTAGDTSCSFRAIASYSFSWKAWNVSPSRYALEVFLVYPLRKALSNKAAVLISRAEIFLFGT
jgi:hypothetical protein